jgi:hypothetical protein
MVSPEVVAKRYDNARNQSKRKQPPFQRETVGPGLLALALLIIWQQDRWDLASGRSGRKSSKGRAKKAIVRQRSKADKKAA